MIGRVHSPHRFRLAPRRKLFWQYSLAAAALQKPASSASGMTTGSQSISTRARTVWWGERVQGLPWPRCLQNSSRDMPRSERRRTRVGWVLGGIAECFCVFARRRRCQDFLDAPAKRNRVMSLHVKRAGKHTKKRAVKLRCSGCRAVLRQGRWSTLSDTGASVNVNLTAEWFLHGRGLA